MVVLCKLSRQSSCTFDYRAANLLTLLSSPPGFPLFSNLSNSSRFMSFKSPEVFLHLNLSNPSLFKSYCAISLKSLVLFLEIKLALLLMNATLFFPYVDRCGATLLDSSS